MTLLAITKFLIILSILTTSISILKILKNGRARPLFLWLTSLFFITCFFLVRAYVKEFFPFTDKVESFITLYWILIFLAFFYHDKFSAKELVAILFIAVLIASAVFLFKHKMRYPTPYLRTIWYPLHVPLSFTAYGFWLLAGIRSIVMIRQKEGDPRFVTDLARMGFIYFTIAMIFGGVWGYLAWGAYFLWDPKIIWSVILWFFYGNMIHIDIIPSLRGAKNYLYAVGIIIILITFIGTGFFTRSIHKF